MKVIVLGTAHTERTPGKRSPDGKFREPYYSREIVAEVARRLSGMGYTVFIDYEPAEPKKEWVSRSAKTEQSRELSYRVTAVNNICKKYGTANVLYVSIHNDAAGSGKWMTAGGWSAYTTPGKTKSDILAECLYVAAEKHLRVYANEMSLKKQSGVYDAKQRPLRIDTTDGDKDKEANFYVLRKTLCAAVLTENLFQDNRSDVEFLTSEAGKKAIVDLHVEGILNYIKTL